MYVAEHCWLLWLQVGVGGDHRAQDQGAHVRQPDHGRMCVGSSPGRQNVSTNFLFILYNMPDWHSMCHDLLLLGPAWGRQNVDAFPLYRCFCQPAAKGSVFIDNIHVVYACPVLTAHLSYLSCCPSHHNSRLSPWQLGCLSPWRWEDETVCRWMAVVVGSP